MPQSTYTSPESDPDLARRVRRKVAWRILPLLFVLYVIAYLDRANVGFAKLQMKDELHFSEEVFGWGFGLFFVGYHPSHIALTFTGPSGISRPSMFQAGARGGKPDGKGNRRGLGALPPGGGMRNVAAARQSPGCGRLSDREPGLDFTRRADGSLLPGGLRESRHDPRRLLRSGNTQSIRRHDRCQAAHRAGVRAILEAREPGPARRLLATFQTIRQTAVIEIRAGDHGGYLVYVVVDRELEDLARPMAPRAGGSLFMENPSVVRPWDLVNGELTTDLTSTWFRIGRDFALEQEILYRMRKGQ